LSEISKQLCNRYIQVKSLCARPDASTKLSSKHCVQVRCARPELVEGYPRALEDIILTQSQLRFYWVPIWRNWKWVKL